MESPDTRTNAPRIGLNTSIERSDNADGAESSVHLDYIDAVARAGGIPVCIPPHDDIEAVRTVLSLLDGFLFIGGRDYHPHRYGGYPQPAKELVDARRDRFDMALAKIVLDDTDLPVLGICGGHQLLAIVRGGALIQDIRTEWTPTQDAPLPHTKDERHTRESVSIMHDLTMREGSLVARATGSANTMGLCVNSFHHQAVRPDRPLAGLYASAWSADGVIEAIEPAPNSAWLYAGRFVLGVQWHPERMQDQPAQRLLFRSLIEAAIGLRL